MIMTPIPAQVGISHIAKASRYHNMVRRIRAPLLPRCPLTPEADLHFPFNKPELFNREVLLSAAKHLSLCLLAALLWTGAPASARVWKPTADALARDYATIQDQRGNGEFVLALWFVPAMVPSSLNGAGNVAAMLDKYVVIAVVHAHVSSVTAAVSFDDVSTLGARDRSGKELALVPMEQLPPVTIGMLATMETVFRQSFGAFGKGLKMFVFDSGAVHACGKGGMSVPFAGETYIWDTPIPGCPHA